MENRDIIVPAGWTVLTSPNTPDPEQVQSFKELVPEAIRTTAKAGFVYKNPKTGAILQKQTNGAWKNVASETTTKGRVQKNNPKSPLASGYTPLEKAKIKLEQHEKAISNLDSSPSEEDLEKYGKLKMAVEQFENTRGGGLVKSRFGLGKKEDTSDLDDSNSRKKGKVIRHEALVRQQNQLAKELGAERHPLKALNPSNEKVSEVKNILKKVSSGEGKYTRGDLLSKEERKVLFTRLAEIQGASANILGSGLYSGKLSPGNQKALDRAVEGQKSYQIPLLDALSLPRDFNVTSSSLGPGDINPIINSVLEGKGLPK